MPLPFCLPTRRDGCPESADWPELRRPPRVGNGWHGTCWRVIAPIDEGPSLPKVRSRGEGDGESSPAASPNPPKQSARRHPSPAWPGTAGAAAAAAGLPGHALRVRLRTASAADDRRRPQDRGAGQRARGPGLSGASAHAAPRDGLLPGRRRPRHAGDPTVPGPPEHPAHRALHRTLCGAV